MREATLCQKMARSKGRPRTKAQTELRMGRRKATAKANSAMLPVLPWLFQLKMPAAAGTAMQQMQACVSQGRQCEQN